MFVRGTGIQIFNWLICLKALSSLLTVCFPCAPAGWRDHKDHESLHKHDCEEALQREVCVQLWYKLDQMIELTGRKMHSATVRPTDNKQARREDGGSARGSKHFHGDRASF